MPDPTAEVALGDPADGRDSDEKKVTWVELFFDLVFVYAVTRTSELLQEGHGLFGLTRCLVTFVPVYWLWVGTTMYANLHDPDRPRARLGVFTVGACGLLMAIAIPEAFGHTGLLFGIAYWAARLALLLLVTGQPFRRAYATFTVAACLSGPLLVAGGFLHGTPRLVVWACAALIDLSVPLFARGRLIEVPFRPDHLVERYGTFILIALGETVVSTATGARELDAGHVGAVLAAFAAVFGLWWVYFTFGPDAMRAALADAQAPIDLIRPVLSYGHLAMVTGVVAIAASLAQVVGDPFEPLHARDAGLLCAGTMIYLVSFAFTRWRLFHTLAVPRLGAAGVVALVWMLHRHVSGLQLLVVLAVVLAALNAVELRILPRTLRTDADQP